MKTTAAVIGPLAGIPAAARALEAQGVDIVSTVELGHDPMLQLAMAATGTSSVELMSSIVVAFGRSPMTLAQQAHDIQSLSGGRLILGLGSQIKPHIEKRYSMPWSKPAARMREYIMALQAIWACWYEGQPLDFRGEFYTHSLMTPMFTPTDTEHGAPPVYAAAVGPLMTESVAEVADGVLLHGFTTEEYIRTVTLPAIEAGLAKSGRARADFKVVGGPFMVTGDTEEEFNAVKRAACKQIAFYGSTPAYRGVLESVGYGELQGELNILSKQGKWDDMALCVDDTLLRKIALVGEPSHIADQLAAKYGDIFDVCASAIFSGDAYGGAAYSRVIGDAIKSI